MSYEDKKNALEKTLEGVNRTMAMALTSSPLSPVLSAPPPYHPYAEEEEFDWTSCKFNIFTWFFFYLKTYLITHLYVITDSLTYVGVGAAATVAALIGAYALIRHLRRRAQAALLQLPRDRTTCMLKYLRKYQKYLPNLLSTLNIL